MAGNLPSFYECRRKEVNECRKDEKYDPRSYCHNVLSKPSKMCKKIACRKFLRTNVERTKGEVLCLPRKPCKLKRLFGPEPAPPEEDEDELFFRMYGSQIGLVLDEGTVSETDILRGRFYGRKANYVSRDGRFGGREIRLKPTKYGLVQDDETEQFLDELSQYLDPEAMAALSALAGAELCPCCNCALCRCKLRGVTSEMELAFRRRGLLEKHVKFWGKGGYAWSFDYHYHPDLDFFRKEREDRLEAERVKAKEQRHSILVEEMLREEGLLPDFPERLVKITDYANIQTDSTITASKGVQAKSSIHKGHHGSKHAGFKDTDSVKSDDDQDDDEDDEDDEKDLELHKRSTSERSSIESWVEARSRKTPRRKLTLITGAAKRPIDTKYPVAPIRGPIRIIEDREKYHQLKIKSATSLEYTSATSLLVSTKKWKSRDRVPPSILSRMVDTGHLSSTQIPAVSQEEIVKDEDEEVDEEESSFEAIRIRSDLARIVEKFPGFDIRRASVAAKERAETRALGISPSRRLYADYCECLPGYCTCGAKHFPFIGLKVADVSTYIEENIMDKETQVEEEEESRSTESSCLCLHPWDTASDLTLASKYLMDSTKRIRVPTKKIKCIQPKYQNTLIIVKPEAMRFKDVILRAIKREGLEVIDERTVHLTPEQVAEIYNENFGSSYFAIFIQRMSSTPILVLHVAGLYAVERWKKLIGVEEVLSSSWFFPESIKRRFGLHTDIQGAMKSSADCLKAKSELRYFFPLDILEPIMIESEEIQDNCDKYIHPTLLKGLYRILRKKPADPLISLAKYLLQNNPFQPSYSDRNVTFAFT